MSLLDNVSVTVPPPIKTDASISGKVDKKPSQIPTIAIGIVSAVVVVGLLALLVVVKRQRLVGDLGDLGVLGVLGVLGDLGDLIGLVYKL